MKIELDLTEEQFKFLTHLLLCKCHELDKEEATLLVGRDFTNNNYMRFQYETEIELLQPDLANSKAVFDQIQKYIT